MNTFEIHKESLKVLCVNAGSSRKLIKNGIYTATNIRTSSSGDRFIYLDNIGSYNIKLFQLLNGDSLKKIPDFIIDSKKIVDPKKNNYANQIVKCRYSSGSYKEDEYYYVEEQKEYEKIWPRGNISYEYKFKIRGFRNSVNSYRFYEIPIIEQRNIKLKNLNGDKIKTAEQTRKFLLYSEKERISILFQVLTKALIDISKIESYKKLDIIKLMLVRGKTYAILEEDIHLISQRKNKYTN